MYLRLLLCGLVLASSGCMTVFQATKHTGPAIYGGVRTYGAMIDDGAPLAILATLDLPLSLMLDTLLLPISAIHELRRGGIDVDFVHTASNGQPPRARSSITPLAR